MGYKIVGLFGVLGTAGGGPAGQGVHTQPAQVQGEGGMTPFPRSASGQRRAQPCFRTIPTPAREEKEGPRASGGRPHRLERQEGALVRLRGPCQCAAASPSAPGAGRPSRRRRG